MPMTWRELLRQLRQEVKFDNRLDEPVELHDVLDVLAVLQMDGAADYYLKRLKEVSFG
jgi:hypothetical protein